MDDPILRLGGFGICWLGIHLIGLGVWENGGAQDGNLVWKVLGPLFRFELTLLVVSLICALAGFVLWVAWALRREAKPVEQPMPVPEAAPIEVALKPVAPNIPAQPEKPPPPKPLPNPRPLTAEELKQKAINELIA